MEPHTVEVRGVPLRWITQGSGAPVVLIHGIPLGSIPSHDHRCPSTSGPASTALNEGGSSTGSAMRVQC